MRPSMPVVYAAFPIGSFRFVLMLIHQGPNNPEHKYKYENTRNNVVNDRKPDHL